MQQATPEDMMSLQHDAYSLKAEEALPVMLAGLAGTELTKAQEQDREILANWDFVYNGKQQAPVLFDSWYDSLYQLTFDEIYRVRSTEYPIELPEAWRFIQLLEADSDNPIFDRQETADRIENRQDLIRLAFQQSSAAIHPEIEKGLNWESHRATIIPHLARIPGFDSGLLNTDGARNTPNALSATFGPSWRMVVSLEKPIRAWGVLPGGASGNIGSAFYAKGIKEWSEGAYFELKLYPSAAEVDALETLNFGNK
jgi:penicillin amidase